MNTDAQTPAVLVVDDDEAIRTMVRRILERENLQVDTAQDGFEAIEKISRKDYAAIFLDLMMPRVDGFGVIEHLDSERPDALDRVIVMSAVANRFQERIQEKIRRVLPKPFDIGKLVQYARELPDKEAV